MPIANVQRTEGVQGYEVSMEDEAEQDSERYAMDR